MKIPRLFPVLVALAALALGGEPAAGIPGPGGTSVEPGDGNLSIDVSDCRVEEFLLIFSEAVGCEIFVDPGIESRITLKADDQTPEKTLRRALQAVDYVIVWKTETDGTGRRLDRIESISVYRSGQKADLVPLKDQKQNAEESGGVALEAPRVVRKVMGARAGKESLAAIARVYTRSKDEEERGELEAIVRAISDKASERGLIAMADSESEAEAGLQEAALCALANMGTATATDHLLARLEKSGAADVGDLPDLIRHVAASQTSVAALRFAAAGNARFPSGRTRVVAIQALGRFQDRQTLDLLNLLAKDSNPSIRGAAAAVLPGGDEDE